MLPLESVLDHILVVLHLLKPKIQLKNIENSNRIEEIHIMKLHKTTGGSEGE